MAEDLLGDTFERVVKSRGRFNARKGSESTWIYTIALNCLRDHLRRSKAEGRALERAAGSGGFSDDGFGDIHERDSLMRALGSLEIAGARDRRPALRRRSAAGRHRRRDGTALDNRARAPVQRAAQAAGHAGARTGVAEPVAVYVAR